MRPLKRPDIAARIRQVLDGAGQNVFHFAATVGISIDHARCIKFGQNDASDNLIERIAQAYNVNEHWLRTGDEPMRSLEPVCNTEINNRPSLATTPDPLTVRQICAAANLTQSALAARFGIPKRTVEDWCRGVAKCAPYIRRMMCECLGLIEK